MASCPTAARSLLTNSLTGTPATAAACFREATCAIPFRKRGFLSFLNGGASPMRTPSSSGYRSSSAPTLVEGRIGKSSRGTLLSLSLRLQVSVKAALAGGQAIEADGGAFAG